MDEGLVESVAQAIYEANGGLTHLGWDGTLPCIREFVRIQARSAISAHDRWTFTQYRAMQETARVDAAA